MRPAGVIVAGGSANRMGRREKPLMLLRGHPLVVHVTERVHSQVSSLALNVKKQAAPLYGEYDLTANLPLLPDGFDGDAGPLGGVLAGLDWAAAGGGEWLATFPADTPFLPGDLVARLAAVSRPDAPAVAVAGERVQGLCALWPVVCRAELVKGIEEGRFRSLWWTLEELGAERCDFADAPAFFNINTEDDLIEAERMISVSEDNV